MNEELGIRNHDYNPNEAFARATVLGSDATATTGSIAIGSNATAGRIPGLYGNPGEGFGLAVAVGSMASALGNSSVAVGNNAMAGGYGAMAMGRQAAALKNNAMASGVASAALAAGSIAFGAQAQAEDKDGIAFGVGMKSEEITTNTANDLYSVRKEQTLSQGEGAIAFGSGARVENGRTVRNALNVNDTTLTATGNTDGAIAFGHDSRTYSKAGLAMGENTVSGVKGDQAIIETVAIGNKAQAVGNISLAIGSEAMAKGNQTIAIGSEAMAKGNQTIAIGYANVVEGDFSGAIGDPSTIRGTNSYTVGNDNIVADNTDGAYGFGANNQFGGTTAYSDDGKAKRDALITNSTSASNSAAVGSRNYINSQNTYVLGSGINTKPNPKGYLAPLSNTVANSVYLGSDSTVTAGQGSVTDGVGSLKNAIKDDVTAGATSTGGATGKVDKGTIYGLGHTGESIALTYGTYAGATAVGGVSVGASGAERRIQNVAAGEISSTSTDAINGSQLYTVANVVMKAMPKVKAGKNVTVDAETDLKTGAITYTVNTGAAAPVQSYAHVNNTVEDEFQPKGNPGTNLGTYDSIGGALGKNDIAIGIGAKSAGGSNSIVIGTNAQSSSTSNATNIVIGKDALTNAESNVVVGKSANIAGAENAVAIGTKAQVTGENGVAIGKEVTATGPQSVAVGAKSAASGRRAIAIGDNAQAQNSQSVSIGRDSVANVNNSVALGNNSQTVESGAHTGGTSIISNATVNGVTYSGFAGSNPGTLGVVSVGTASDPRRVQHVAAGLISDQSTDAINGSQLYLVADKLKTEIDTKITDFTTSVNGKLVETINKDNKDVNFVNGTGTTARADGQNITFDVKYDNSTITLNDKGELQANVKTPETSDLAPQNNGTVNVAGDTLNLVTAGQVANAINKSGFKLTTGANGGENLTASPLKADGDMINPGDTVTMIAGKNLTVTQTTEGNITYATGETVDFTTVTIGGETPTITINTDGIDMGDTSITNLKPNLTPTFNKDAVTPNGDTTEGKPAVTVSAKLPDNVNEIVNNAATVGDILNSGWNLQNNGNSVDFVKPYDTVNFVDGKGTTAVAKPNDDGTVSNVQYDINVDNSTIVF
ncbi:beta strand repeat-containing protein, partial [Neisseria animalis]